MCPNKFLKDKNKTFIQLGEKSSSLSKTTILKRKL